ncbi:hypothetical protein BX666DRAFT_1917061 [Dichotomocladium elegans]|nr:hypothetical protein BX666DRAFT_1917061 [Dichotomocladium elegans]
MLRMYSLMHLQHVWSKPMDVIPEEPQSQQQQYPSPDADVPPRITECALQQEPESLEELEPATAEAIEPVKPVLTETPSVTDTSDQTPAMLPSPPPSYEGEQEEQHREMPAEERPSISAVVSATSSVHVDIGESSGSLHDEADHKIQIVQQEPEVSIPTPVSDIGHQEAKISPKPAVVETIALAKDEDQEDKINPEPATVEIVAPAKAEELEVKVSPEAATAEVIAPAKAEEQEDEATPAPTPAPAPTAAVNDDVTGAIADQAIQQQKQVEEEKQVEEVAEKPTPTAAPIIEPQAPALEEEQVCKPLPVVPPVQNGFQSKYSSKRDSKISTNSQDSISFHDDGLKRTATIATDRSFAARARSFDEPDRALPPASLTLKPSRSSQIQAKVATQRKRLSMRLKRAFSVSTKTN